MQPTRVLGVMASDEPSHLGQRTVNAVDIIEGFNAFTEKRTPSWSPEEFRSGGRL